MDSGYAASLQLAIISTGSSFLQTPKWKRHGPQLVAALTMIRSL
jgi:hypothetical protein